MIRLPTTRPTTALALLCALAAGVPLSQARAEPRAVRVCIYEFMPLVGSNEGVPQGLYVDLLQHVAAQEDWSLKFVVRTWDECLGMVSRGEVDLQPCIGWTPERARTLEYNSIHPYLDWGVVYARRRADVRTVFDLAGKRIGVLQGSLYTEAFRSLLDQFGITATIVEKPTYHGIFDAIEKGEVDAGINGQLAGARLGGVHAVEPTQVYFSPVKLLLAAPRGRTAGLLATLDRHFDALRGQPGSAWHEAQARWTEPGHVGFRPPAWLAPAIGLGAALLLLFVTFTWLLRVQVARRTSDLSAANGRLAQSEALRSATLGRLKRAQQIAGLGSWTLDLPSGRVEWSEQLHVILGLDPASPPTELGVLLTSSIHPEDRAAVEHAQRTALEHGHPVSLQYRVLLPGGEARHVWAESSVTARDHDGRPLGLSGTIQDITERVRLEEQLRQSQKLEALGRLSGGIAHDFNNLLAVQASVLKALRADDFQDPEERLEAIDDLQASVTRASDLTRQLLLFGRRGVPALGRVDLNAVVTEAGRMLRHALREGIALQVETAAAPLWIEADAGMLQQVTLNLCMNARDAMVRGGLLRVATGEALLAGDGPPDRPGGRFAYLQVSDTGVGISDAHRQLVFDPFFTTKQVGKGTGLGLTTVHGIARQHGGWVEVESEIERGSTFTVYLPLFGAPASRSQAGAPPPTKPG